MNNENGQLILVLILVMVVALGIGLSVVQKSLVDVSTSTKVEESSRAFSAAEAGIEKALQIDNSIPSPIALGNQAKIAGVEKNAIPQVPEVNSRQLPLEYPPLSKEEIAQVWLSDLYSSSNPPPPYYTQNSLDVFWGQPNIADANERPAIEIKVIEYRGGAYHSRPFYLDPVSSRAQATNFSDVSSGCSNTLPSVTTTFGDNRSFYCKWTLTGLGPTLMLLRSRILYSSASQPFALQAVGSRGVGACASGGCWLPTQARIFTSTGVSGETQRKVSVFRLDKVVPHYFDYAIFSAGEIKK